MKRYANDFTVFQEKWNAAHSVRDLVGTLGRSENSISAYASVLRRRGVSLKIMGNGTRKNGITVEQANKAYFERHPEMIEKI